MDLQSYVAMSNDQITTTSLQVAKAFGKRHSHVLEKLNALDCSDEFASANFSADVQKVDIGNGAQRESKIYHMTKDGFMFLVMGFTGKQAAAIKEAYIGAFNAMADELLQLTLQATQPQLPQLSVGNIVDIELPFADSVGFESNGTTWITERHIWQMFYYNSPFYFRNLFYSLKHMLPEGSYREMTFEEESEMGRNTSKFPIARDKNKEKFMVFNLDAIQTLAMHCRTCDKAAIMKWVMGEVKRHAIQQALPQVQLPQRFLVSVEGGTQQIIPIADDAIVASGHELPKFIPEMGLDDEVLEEVMEVSNRALRKK